MTAATPTISVIIVSWNSRGDLPACLDALRIAAQNLPGPLEVLVVDNDSNDGTRDYIRSERLDAQLIEMGSNTGFPRACNRGLAHVRSHFTLLLNPDVVVQPDALARCLDLMETDPSVGVCGARLVDEHGHVQPESARRFPNLWWLIVETFYLHVLFPNTRLFGGLNFGEWDHASSRPVPCIVGAFMFFRTDLLRRIGGLDETVFMYFEDIDVCRTVWRSAHRVYYLAEAVCEHEKGTSRAKSRANFDALKGEIVWRFVAKHRSRHEAHLVIGMMVVYATLRLLLMPAIAAARLLRRQPTRLRDLAHGNLGVLAWAFAPKRWPERAT